VADALLTDARRVLARVERLTPEAAAASREAWQELVAVHTAIAERLAELAAVGKPPVRRASRA
jgi:hypothetical protein